MNTVDNVSIKFKPGAYKLFRSLQYKVWLALAEYIDNSVQSYLSNKDELIKVNNDNYQFRIDIKYENDFIHIRDNAAGINTQNIQRAFEPANIPENNLGLNEFGMGMKTASIWLSENWSVRTAALGELEERFIEFDLTEVTSKNREELPVVSNTKEANVHFTEIILCQLTDNGKNRQLERIKKHISSIHRNLIRSGELLIAFNEEILSFIDPVILTAPYYKTNEEDIYWKEEIDCEFGKYKVKGFIGILEKMSTTVENGFALFRRGRVIEGSHDQKYRPHSLSGQVGSPRFKRIFGELELDGFDVSFDKGSFRNPEELDYLLEQLKIELSKKSNNIFLQAEHYRIPKTKDGTQKAVKKTIDIFRKEQDERKENPDKELNNTLQGVQIIHNGEKIEINPIVNEDTKIGVVEESKIINNCTHNLILEFISDKNNSDFYSFTSEGNSSTKEIKCYINLAHPFFVKYDSSYEKGDYSTILQIIKNLIYAELASSAAGAKHAGYIRLNFNKFIRNL